MFPFDFRAGEGDGQVGAGRDWSPELNLVITVDEYKYVAVSVLTGNGSNR